MIKKDKHANDSILITGENSRFCNFLKKTSLSRPKSIGFKIEIIITLLLFLNPCLGQVYPELIATG